MMCVPGEAKECGVHRRSEVENERGGTEREDTKKPEQLRQRQETQPQPLQQPAHRWLQNLN